MNRLTRHELCDGSELYFGALPEALRLDTDEFELLWSRHPEEFHQVRNPKGEMGPTARWQQAYEKNYVYSGSVNNALPLHVLTAGIPKIAQCVQWCKETIDERLNGVLCNWYEARLGHYISAHRDSRKGLIEGVPIVTVSFGDSRTFRLRQYRNEKEKVDFRVDDGSVIVIPAETNRRWKHEVVKTKRARGRRVSVTLRGFA